MKRTILLISAILILAIALVAVNFYWNELRGAGPAFKKPSLNIAEIFDDLISGSDNLISPSVNNTDLPLNIPNGFSIGIYERNLGKARTLIQNPLGDIIVAQQKQGRVIALPDRNQDQQSDQIVILADNLNTPHGLLLECPESQPLCTMYIAELTELNAYTYDPLDNILTFSRLVGSLPGGGRHTTRSLLRDPNNPENILISIGSTCDVCYEADPRHGSIISMNESTGKWEPYARGLRNAVFMTLRPGTNEIYATEMGRDRLGDDLPPDEINLIEQGNNYGWPVCYGKNVHDTAFDSNTYIRPPCEAPLETGSLIDLQAHSAPLGIAFFPDTWPSEFRNSFLVAYHGSWNRSVPTGYKIVRFTEQDGHFTQSDFITGWLQGTESLGRPVDILISDAGVIFISDDHAGVIYVLQLDTDKPEVSVTSPLPGSVVSSPIQIAGRAPASWFFEGSAPTSLVDAEGNTITQGFITTNDKSIQAQNVEFSGTLTFEESDTPVELKIWHANASNSNKTIKSVTVPITK